MGFATSLENSAKASIKELSGSFDVALLNRFKYRINFNAISKEVYADIMRETYEKEVARILKDKPKLNLNATISDSELDELVANSYAEEFGARPIYETITRYIEDLVFPAV